MEIKVGRQGKERTREAILFVVFDLLNPQFQKRLNSEELINVNYLKSTNSKEKDGP